MSPLRLAAFCLVAAFVGFTQADDSPEPSAKILESQGGGDKAPVTGGAVIVDSHGRRLELIPPKRPAPAPGARVLKEVAALPKLSLPTLDDPSAGLEARKRRAAALLIGTAVGAFLLAAWARRWRR